MLNSRLCYWYFLANFFPRTFVSSIYQHNYWINVKKQGQNWLFKIIVFVNALVKCQNTKQGFEIHELRSVFGKLRIEISKGYFLYLLLISKIPALSGLNIFSFQIVLLTHSNKVRITLPVSTFRAYAWVTTIVILFTE